MAKNKFRSGFRYNNSPKAKGHLTYVYAQDGSDYKYLGITHSKKKGHHTNYPLKSNPNPNDARKSYVRKHPEKDMKKYMK